MSHPSVLSRRRRLNLAAVIVLAVGFGTGGALYWRSTQVDPPDDEDGTLALEDTRAYRLGMEKNVGEFGLLTAQWSESIEKLGEPRPLAVTVLVASGLAAGGCFLAARREPHP